MIRDYYDNVFRPELEKAAAFTVHGRYDSYLADFLRFAGQDVAITAVNEDLLSEFRQWCSRVRALSITSIDHRWRFIRRIVAHWRPKPPSANGVVRPARNTKSDAPEGTLLWLLETHYLPERGIAARTEGSYRDALSSFRRFLEREPAITDLTKATVNDYLEWLERRGLSMRTVKDQWNVLRLLWRYAWDNELVADLPRGIRKLRLAPVVPTSWTPEEMTRLLSATQATMLNCWTGPQGSRVHVGRFLYAVVWLAHDTGWRKSDLFAVTWDQLHLEPDGRAGRIVLITQKTRQPHVSRVRQETIEALAAVRRDGDSRLLPWPRRVDRFYPFYRQLLFAAGLPVGKRNGLQKLRRTSASWLESTQPGMASWHLGHLTPGLARKHYLDPAVCTPAYLPPAIPEPPKLLEGPGEREDVV
jgi:site-specific recombinase XerD